MVRVTRSAGTNGREDLAGPGCPPRLRPVRFGRAGGGAPGGSDDGGREELPDDLPSRASSSLIRASSSQTRARSAAFSRSNSSIRSSRQSRATIGDREATFGIVQASEHVGVLHGGLDQAVRAVNAYDA